MNDRTPSIDLPAAVEPMVSLLIPTTNQDVKLAACLKSLAAHLPANVPCEVIVVLNAATDDVLRLIYKECTGLKIAESAANLGVAGGYNRARSLAKGDFLVLLHDDVEIGPSWLEPLLAAAAAHPGAGAIGSRTFNADGTEQRSGSILWRNGLTSPAPVPPDNLAAPWPVDYCGTCALMVRTQLWDALGGLDEQIYPAYFVDVDLCMGLRRLGATVLCDPTSSLRHHSRSSSPKPFSDFVSMRNRAYFLAKWAEAMPDYEPWSPDDPEAISRAVRRTRQIAGVLASKWQPIPSVAPPRHDAGNQEIRHFRLASQAAEAWSDHQIEALTAEIKSARAYREQQIARLLEKVAARDRKIENLKARCDRLQTKLKKPQRAAPWQRLHHWLKERCSSRASGSGPASPSP